MEAKGNTVWPLSGEVLWICLTYKLEAFTRVYTKYRVLTQRVQSAKGQFVISRFVAAVNSIFEPLFTEQGCSSDNMTTHIIMYKM